MTTICTLVEILPPSSPNPGPVTVSRRLTNRTGALHCRMLLTRGRTELRVRRLDRPSVRHLRSEDAIGLKMNFLGLGRSNHLIAATRRIGSGDSGRIAHA